MEDLLEEVRGAGGASHARPGRRTLFGEASSRHLDIRDVADSYIRVDPDVDCFFLYRMRRPTHDLHPCVELQIVWLQPRSTIHAPLGQR